MCIQRLNNLACRNPGSGGEFTAFKDQQSDIQESSGFWVCLAYTHTSKKLVASFLSKTWLTSENFNLVPECRSECCSCWTSWLIGIWLWKLVVCRAKSLKHSSQYSRQSKPGSGVYYVCFHHQLFAFLIKLSDIRTSTGYCLLAVLWQPESSCGEGFQMYVFCEMDISLLALQYVDMDVKLL